MTTHRTWLESEDWKQLGQLPAKTHTYTQQKILLRVYIRPINKYCRTHNMILQSNYSAYKEPGKPQLVRKDNQYTSMPRWCRCKMLQLVTNTLEINRKS